MCVCFWYVASCLWDGGIANGGELSGRFQQFYLCLWSGIIVQQSSTLLLQCIYWGSSSIGSWGWWESLQCVSMWFLWQIFDIRIDGLVWRADRKWKNTHYVGSYAGFNFWLFANWGPWHHPPHLWAAIFSYPTGKGENPLLLKIPFAKLHNGDLTHTADSWCKFTLETLTGREGQCRQASTVPVSLLLSWGAHSLLLLPQACLGNNWNAQVWNPNI
jgi:hypothetical protein